MKLEPKKNASRGGGRTYLLLWLIGIPAPILLLAFFLRGCH